MEVVPNNYLPGDPRLVDQIVYELKSQGIFDQFRKECISDVDTKPAYQNLRQRVEGSVASFLRQQKWKPDMNKNQVREMLRKNIYECGFLETGVERIVDQVVNPKINTIFLPRVEEVVYRFYGVEKPNRNNDKKGPLKVDVSQNDLLPHDLEAVSPESVTTDKKDDNLDDSRNLEDDVKVDEDESPAFEPLDEQISFMQEDNSVDSHMSGFSGLASHESNHSSDTKGLQIDLSNQDSQMSRNSSDSRLSIVTSDDNTKMEICEDSQSKSIKSYDSTSKVDSNPPGDKETISEDTVKKSSAGDSKNKNDDKKSRSSDKYKSRSDKDRKDDKDKKSSSSKDRSRHSSSSKDKPRERHESKSSSSSKSKRDEKEKSDKDKDRSRSSSKYSSNTSRDKSSKKDSKSRSSSSSHRDSKSKSSDSKSKSSSTDKYKKDDKYSHSNGKHSSSTSSSKNDKDRRAKKDSKDDHYSSKDKKTDRRSTDRDSNDGQSSKFTNNPTTDSNSSQSQKSNQESTVSNTGNGSGNPGNSDPIEKPPVNITDSLEGSEVMIASSQVMRLNKPKFASNIHEARKLMKIRKQLAKLEKQNKLSLSSMDVIIDKPNGVNEKAVDLEENRQNSVLSKEKWDALEARLYEEMANVSNDYAANEDEDSAEEANKESPECRYLDKPTDSIEKNLEYLTNYVDKLEKVVVNKEVPVLGRKRKLEEHADVKNNNKHLALDDEAQSTRALRETLENSVDTENNFTLPLSPAESEPVSDKKDETAIVAKPKRNSNRSVLLAKQRYSSDDLYKPRPVIGSSRRRGTKPDN